MKGIRIQGGMPLQGKVRIQGSKKCGTPDFGSNASYQ